MPQQQPILPTDVIPPRDQSQPQQQRDQTQVWRSSRVPIPTEKAAPDADLEMRTERAVRESREASERVRESCAEQKRMLDDLREQPEEMCEVIQGDPDLDRVLAALAEQTNGEPDLDPTDLDAE
ncbi:hypothetical protein DXG01_000847, partial [Tephrocybe rancida]